MSEKLSLIVPVVDEQNSIRPFLHAINTLELPVDLEVIFVDDGSTDDTLDTIRRERANFDFEVNYLSFSRNFGKEAGMYAGLEHATGSLVGFIDVDLQDPVHLLQEMVEDVLRGSYDVSAARRVNRSSQGFIRGFLSKSFYWVMNKIFGVHLESGERDYRVMNRKAADALLQLAEEKRFSKGLFHWIGFKTHFLEFQDEDRQDGTSHWSMSQLFAYAMDGIFSFSTRPLILVSGLGLLSFVLSILFIIAIIIRAILDPGSAVLGWASLVSIILLASGIQLMSLGVIGKYVADVFTESKHRPKYLLQDSSYQHEKAPE